MLFSKFFWNFNFTFLILWSKFALYQRNCNFYSAMKDLKEKNYVLGIDMGGTNTEFAVVNARGEIVDRDSIPTVGHRDIYDYVARLKSGVEALVKRSNTRGCLRGIGVGAPCANRYTGCIEAATDLPWPSPIPLAALLEQAFSLPVSITNDANAAAAGEMAYGRARGLKTLLWSLSVQAWVAVLCVTDIFYRALAGLPGNWDMWLSGAMATDCAAAAGMTVLKPTVPPKGWFGRQKSCLAVVKTLRNFGRFPKTRLRLKPYAMQRAGVMPSQMRSMILQDVCLGKRVRISPLLQILRLLFFLEAWQRRAIL